MELNVTDVRNNAVNIAAANIAANTAQAPVRQPQNTNVNTPARPAQNPSASPALGLDAPIENNPDPGRQEVYDHRRVDEQISIPNQELTEEFLERTIEAANRKLALQHMAFDFSIHEATNEFIIKVIDTETEEVIREIPPERNLDAVARMWELAGIFVDERN